MSIGSMSSSYFAMFHRKSQVCPHHHIEPPILWTEAAFFAGLCCHPNGVNQGWPYQTFRQDSYRPAEEHGILNSWNIFNAMRWHDIFKCPLLGLFYAILLHDTECTKIAHRRSLAIFTADEGIARNSAARTIFTQFLRRRNRGSLAIFFAEEIAHLGASKNRAIFWGAVEIAAAAAENRAILVHSGMTYSHNLQRKSNLMI